MRELLADVQGWRTSYPNSSAAWLAPIQALYDEAFSPDLLSVATAEDPAA